VERRADPIRLLTAIVFIGGLARLAGVLFVADPGRMALALFMELAIAPALCLWQTRLAVRSLSPFSLAK
jgi:hypothetical protein